LQVGQSVFAIGNPSGLDQSLTTAVISALGHEIDSVPRRPIQGGHSNRCGDHPGNSGGPLCDSAGRSISVNTQIYSPTGASAGIGFAIPVDTVNRIVPELIRSGKIIRPGLGVELTEEQIAKKIDVSGPASKAEVRPTRRESSGRVILGPVITAVAGKKVDSPNDLFLILEDYRWAISWL
jgi:S1-C subfamily serine protease